MAILSSSPTLQATIDSIANEFIHTLMSGDGITEENLDTDPAVRQAKACAKFALDLTTALETWLIATQFLVVPGTLATAGSPVSHVNVSPGTIIKQ